MLWKGRRQSDNVEDARGESGGGFPGGFGGGPGRIRIGPGVGGGSLSGILILVVLFFVLRAIGIDPTQLITGEEPGGSPGGGTVTNANAPASDEMKAFVSTVLAETEDVWTGIFQAEGKTYTDPKLLLFSGQIQSACGFASAASGPFYCPEDQKVYLDTSFFDQLDRQFGASGD